jgi:CRISPR-associated endonuclease/helicase Cas3
VPDLFGFALSPSGDFRAALKLSDFQSTDKKGSDRAWERLERTLNSSVLIVAGTFAGLHEGLLNETVADPPTCGDTSGDFATGFTVGTVNALNRANDQRFAFTFPVEFGQESETPTQWLVVEGRENQDGKALAKAMQLLVEHQDWTGQAARRISERLCLTQTLAAPVEIAARLHDEGKKAANWQAAFKAPRDGIYGKTKGPILQNVLDGYRHEFGSLPYAQEDMAFKALAPEMQDLVLHLIAAHHGNARPVIDTCGCPDAPPLLLQDRARDVALRYARLQKRFGPWGLAWLEALVRAADQQASRNLETQANG